MSVLGRRSAKLAKCYNGPFPVIEKIGHVAYRVKLPEGSCIHPVFHISILKPFRAAEGTSPIPTLKLPSVALQSHPFPKPLAVCAIREILHQGKPQKQTLIQWEGELL